MPFDLLMVEMRLVENWATNVDINKWVLFLSLQSVVSMSLEFLSGKVCEQEMERQEILFWVVQSVMKIIKSLVGKHVP